MGASCDCRNPITDSVNILNMEQETDKEYDFIRKRDLEIFKFPRISSNDYDFVKKKFKRWRDLDLIYIYEFKIK